VKEAADGDIAREEVKTKNLEVTVSKASTVSADIKVVVAVVEY
jgi:hypothetical protein